MYLSWRCPGGSGRRFLCEDAQLLAGAEFLYLCAEDLAESHVPEVKRCPVGDFCAAEHGSCGGVGVGPGQGVRDHVRRTW